MTIIFSWQDPKHLIQKYIKINHTHWCGSASLWSIWFLAAVMGHLSSAWKQIKVSKGAKIRNRCNQVPHLTQDTNRKVTNSQLDTTNESQEVSPFPAGDHKRNINRRSQRHSKYKTEKNPPWNGQWNILLEGLNRFNGANMYTMHMNKVGLSLGFPARNSEYTL